MRLSVEEQQPFNPWTLAFFDREVTDAYNEAQRKSLAQHVSRAAVLIILLSSAMSMWVGIMASREPMWKGSETAAIQALLWKLVIPTLATGWVLARTKIFERIYPVYLLSGAFYIGLGWLWVVHGSPNEVVLMLGPTLTVLVIYNIFTLGRIGVFACVPIGLTIVLGYTYVASLHGASSRTIAILFGSLFGALVFAFISGFLIERFRRQSFYATLISEQRRAEAERLAHELDAISRSDPLTGIPNRRAFDENMTRGLLRCARTREPISVLLVDVDLFKRFNDCYGHAAGDACLVRIAHLLAAQATRPDDLAARWGGEEFAVLLPNTDLEGALKVAQDIHAAVRAAQIPHAQSAVSKCVTLSIGVASCVPSPDHACKELFEAADRALYQAKREGRDRTVCAEQVEFAQGVAVG